MAQLSNFAVTGALRVSPGRMYGVLADGKEEAIQVVRSCARGVQGQASAKDDKKKSANIQAMDVAFLPEACNTLRVKFQLIINRQDGYGVSVCNVADVDAVLNKLHAKYAEIGGYALLAERYVENLASGKFLWRNAYGIGAPKVMVHFKAVDGADADQSFDLSVAEARGAVTAKFADALAGKSVFVARIEATVVLGEEAQVYPSEELVTNKAAGEGRVLAKDDRGRAQMHSQKIGNALRRIDDWHGAAVGRLPVEPFGTDLVRCDAVRMKTNSFYAYLSPLASKGEAAPVAQAIIEASSTGDLKLQDAHYFMAMLVRGGVFGEADSSTTVEAAE